MVFHRQDNILEEYLKLIKVLSQFKESILSQFKENKDLSQFKENKEKPLKYWIDSCLSMIS